MEEPVRRCSSTQIGALIAFYFGIGFTASVDNGIYIGLWVPAILALGNLMVKKGK